MKRFFIYLALTAIISYLAIVLFFTISIYIFDKYDDKFGKDGTWQISLMTSAVLAIGCSVVYMIIYPILTLIKKKRHKSALLPESWTT
ncbi:MAG: hypothetical protein JXR78_12885 [Victivallales bacterium]|nr:hypothetical protein [Victivallales bacterium]